MCSRGRQRPSGWLFWRVSVRIRPGCCTVRPASGPQCARGAAPAVSRPFAGQAAQAQSLRLVSASHAAEVIRSSAVEAQMPSACVTAPLIPSFGWGYGVVSMWALTPGYCRYVAVRQLPNPQLADSGANLAHEAVPGRACRGRTRTSRCVTQAKQDGEARRSELRPQTGSARVHLEPLLVPRSLPLWAARRGWEPRSTKLVPPGSAGGPSGLALWAWASHASTRVLLSCCSSGGTRLPMDFPLGSFQDRGVRQLVACLAGPAVDVAPCRSRRPGCVRGCVREGGDVAAGDL